MLEHISNMRVLGMFSLKKENGVLVCRGRMFSILPESCLDCMMCTLHSVREIFKATKSAGDVFLPAEKVEMS